MLTIISIEANKYKISLKPKIRTDKYMTRLIKTKHVVLIVNNFHGIYFSSDNISISADLHRREGGDIWLFNSLVPKVFNVFLFVGLITLGNFIGWVIKLSVQTFQPLNVIYSRGNFVYHHI